MKEYLAVFDLDGTLFDTREPNFLSYREAVARQGFTLDRPFFDQRCFGRYYLDFLPELLGPAATPQRLEQIHRDKKALYPSFVSHARENRALFDLMDVLRPQYALALCTTASSDNCRQLLRAFGREACFDLILTQEDVTRKKPDPQGYLLAMERLSVPPERTLIFEDAPEGIEAGRRSGASVLAVPFFPAK